MANGLQDFLGATNPFDAQPSMEPGPLAYDPMNTGQGSMGMDAGGPGGTNFMSDTEETFKDRLLNPQSEADQLFTLEARGNMEDPNKSPDEKRQSWRNTFDFLRLMDTYDIPTQQEIVTSIKADMLDMGIDLDAYSKVNRTGDKYIAAGSTLTEATRAGYTPLQAISKALGAYGAAERAAQLPDPNQVNTALKLYEMAGDTRAAMIQAGATGAERDTFVVGPEGDQTVMALNGNDQKTLDRMAVPYRGAQESDIKATPYAFIKNGEIVTESLNQFQFSRNQSNGIDMIEATPENLNSEMNWVDDDGFIERGTVNDYLVARDLDEDVRQVDESESMEVQLSATGQTAFITKRKYLQDLEKSEKDPNYNMKYFPADKASTIPQIDVSSSPEGGFDLSLGPAQQTQVSPTAGLSKGEVTDVQKVTKANEKQIGKIDDFTEAEAKVFKQRTDGLEKFAEIGTKLLNGLEGTDKGGTGQRLIGTVAGIGTTVQDTINFLTTKTANKPYVEKFQAAFDAGDDVVDDETGAVIGAWNQFKLSEEAPLWKDLKQIGLTDLQEMNTLAFNLAIASLRAKGIEDRGITNQKIALEMQSLGFGGTTRTNDEAVAGLKAFLGLALDDYERYRDTLFDVSPMSITETIYVPGKGNIRGGNVSDRTRVNPWVYNDFAREVVGEDGEVTYESTGQLTPFDTEPLRERLGTVVNPLGTVNQQGNVVIRVNDDPSTIASYYMQDKDWFNTRPLNIPTAADNPGMSIPTGMSSYGQMAVTFAEERSEAHRRIINDGYMPGSPDYKREMSAVLGNLYEQYALNYFGEEAMDPKSTSPQRIAFDKWFEKARSLPLSGDIN